MTQREQTQRLLKEQLRKYPSFQIRDVFKFLHQSCFGCEHAVSSIETAIDYIEREYKDNSVGRGELTEKLDGNYSRASLGWLDEGLSAATLGKLFFASAQKEPSGAADLEEKLCVARELVREGELPFDPSDFEREEALWREAGFPALHHSDIYRNSYRPSYRVILDAYANILPLLAKIDKALSRGAAKVTAECGEAERKDLEETLRSLYGAEITINIR